MAIASDRPPRRIAARASDTPPPARGAGQEAVTNAAREIFAERGYHGTSIRDIAKHAGLSLSALYYWYSSKQELLAALIEEADVDYHARCERALAAVGDKPVDRLRALVRATVEYRVERRLESSIVARESRNLEPESIKRMASHAREATKMWADVIDDGVQRKAFRCAHPDDARRTVIAACNAIAQWYNPDGEITVADLVDRYTDIAFRVVDVRTTKR
ncbi:TetR family transcriptional regulator [Rhizocola hellebori]|uniref:TetR family transcriptional regulator n=1 Tax=Rhizocola hellebori TaxID=1392758 RepID=A0A8J3Q3Y5_9ACTN|nr:TetR/AcrR family transcriptional regulator [Rhizocola hellebori]GIH03004.1 TetR family transcriptional regulator [Rhizocola hellebori]